MYRDVFQIDRYSSSLSKTTRIWHLKCFKNLGFFMTMRHIWSWQLQLLEEEDGHWRGSLLSLWDIWARNGSCLDFLMNWTFRTHREMTAELPKGEMILQGSCFMKECARHSAGHRRKTLTNIGLTVLDISCLIEKSAGYYGPVDWRWMLQWNRRTCGDCPCREMSLSILEFWKLLALLCTSW